jgi:hypothetical protein
VSELGSARRIGDILVALFHVTTQRRRAARGDGVENALVGQRYGVGVPIGVGIAAHDVGDFVDRSRRGNGAGTQEG